VERPLRKPGNQEKQGKKCEKDAALLVPNPSFFAFWLSGFLRALSEGI
jgi:hypothetical protein